MTFLVCLPVEVLIPVSENTEEYSVIILYLYGYKVTFFPLLPHWHRDLSLFHFSRKWASSQIFCRASSTQQRVKIYMLLWGKMKNCGTVELSCAEQKPSAFTRSSELYIHSLKINELCHLSWQGKHPLTLFPLLTCPVFWQKTVHAFQALSLNCWHHKVSYVH